MDVFIPMDDEQSVSIKVKSSHVVLVEPEGLSTLF